MYKLLCLLSLMNGINCIVSDTETRLKELESLVKEHISDTKEIKDRLTKLERNVSELVTKNVHINTEYGSFLLSGDLKQVSNHKALLRIATAIGHQSKRTSDEDVAFHAYLSSTRQYSNHQIFAFDTVTVNTGGGYTPYDGIFDVPVAGIYVFTWTVAVPALSGKIVTELVVRGVVKGVMTSDPDGISSTGSGLHPATAFVVTRVSAGDNVFIRMRNVSGAYGTVLSDSSNGRTSFSGWLMF